MKRLGILVVPLSGVNHQDSGLRLNTTILVVKVSFSVYSKIDNKKSLLSVFNLDF